MDGYQASTYGDHISEFYDDLYPGAPTSEQIDLLNDLAGDGPVLELGIGTGRLAIPLAKRGVPLTGLDSSEAMVSKLREKEEGESIPVSIGDFEQFELGRQFRLIFVAFNTFFGLLTQEAQISCFDSVARHLTEDGAFLVEAFVPDLGRFDRGQRTNVSHVGLDRTIIEVAMHSPATQRVDAQHIVIEEDRPVSRLPVSLRYSWPAELDLMARLAGLRLRDRWADWDRSAFGDESSKHISVWSR